jgi:hypothetical protein
VFTAIVIEASEDTPVDLSVTRHVNLTAEETLAKKAALTSKLGACSDVDTSTSAISFEELQLNMYWASTPGETRTLNAKFCLIEKRDKDDAITTFGGSPSTGTTSTLALLERFAEAVTAVTTTVQVL